MAQYAGTLPQWATLAAILIALIKLVPALRAQTIEGKDKDLQSWRQECTDLREAIRQCEAKHKQHADECSAEIKALHEEIFGIRRQHVAEQISLINVIVQSVDAPELRGLLKMMESVQTQLFLQRKRDEENDQRA